MQNLPDLDGNVNRSPHVVVLGAGASRASFPNGDAGGLKLPLMNDLVELVGLTDLLKKQEITLEEGDFESLYDDMITSGQNPNLAREIEKLIYDYFSQMRLSDSPTIYDYLILSLREKDIIATFNWDPFLCQAYRRNMHVANPPQIAFLHGSVEVGVCYKDKIVNFIGRACSKCRCSLEPAKLLYPVKHKDYNNDPFINGEWDKLTSYLNRAYFLTIFGYSAPVTDVEAKKLMLEVWKDNPTLELAQIEMVDIKSIEELKKSWEKFIVREHYQIRRNIFESYLFTHPRRSCDAFAAATLMNDPWEENPFPQFETFGELHEWIKPLIDEEKSCK